MAHHWTIIAASSQLSAVSSIATLLDVALADFKIPLTKHGFVLYAKNLPISLVFREELLEESF
ncbi:MAG: hypothetical protein F6J93_22340 [Oscillatoria sp. SIO1A7]|nr:hypothetical protein [Oscillatoria sp. SIO1A7]